MTKTISKSRLKAKMLEYLRQVEETGEDLIVTNHREPVIRISPLQKKHSIEEIFGDVRGTVDISDDILLPETAEWGDIG